MSLLRNIARKLLFRGSLRKFWISGKTARLTKAYQAVLRGSLGHDGVAGSRPRACGEKLRRLLFICDNMWEDRELVPELERICPTTYVDVHAWVDRRSIPETLPAERVIERLKGYQNQSYDCILVYLRSSLQSRELLDYIRKTWSCPLIGMNLDCKTTFEDYRIFNRKIDNYKAWIQNFDCNLTNARAMVDVYHAHGASCLYLPTGFHFDPQIHKKPVAVGTDFTMSFVGSHKPERAMVVDQLRRQGIPVEVFGQGWGGQSFVSDAWNIYTRTQINLGIGYNVAGTSVTNLKNRDFECPSSGACYLTTYDWELADLFEIGKEILCYRSTDDLIELYSYYSRRPGACLEIAGRAYDRCRREHTWEQRFRKIFSELGFSLAAPAGI